MATNLTPSHNYTCPVSKTYHSYYSQSINSKNHNLLAQKILETHPLSPWAKSDIMSFCFLIGTGIRALCYIITTRPLQISAVSPAGYWQLEGKSRAFGNRSTACFFLSRKSKPPISRASNVHLLNTSRVSPRRPARSWGSCTTTRSLPREHILLSHRQIAAFS